MHWIPFCSRVGQEFNVFSSCTKKKHECFTYAQHPVDPILFARQTAAFPAAFSKTKNLKSQCPSKFLSKKAIIESTQ